MQSPHRQVIRLVACAGLIGLLSTGCELEPDVGPLQADRCRDDDSDPDHPVSFSRDIQPLIARENGGCFKCHTPGGDNPVGLSIGGLNLSTYDTLRAGGARTASDIVVPGSPCGSAIYLKLEGAPFGSQMPADGPPFWTDAETDLVHDWIAEGAENN